MTSEFEEQGYTILRGLIEPEVVRDVRDACVRLVDDLASRLASSGRLRDVHPDAPFETRMARLFENHLDVAPRSFRRELHLPGFFGLFFHDRLLDTVEAFLGPEIRLYPNYTVRPKLPEWEGTEVLWHQDGGYTAKNVASGGVDALRMINVWTPLVPATEHNGCMQFIPGTHRLGVVPHEQRRHYLEIAADELDPRRTQAVAIELDPGDVVLFHNLLFHCGLPNRSNEVRWSVDWRYQDATQSTMRKEEGHLARSRTQPGRVVQSSGDWANRTFR